MSHIALRALRASRTLLFALLLAVPAAQSHARVPARNASAAPVVAPQPLRPLDGEHLAEGTARLEVATGSGAKELRLVIARWPFEAGGWSALPSGAGWTVLPWRDEPVALAPLGLADRTDTPLWWAVVWTDSTTGKLRASESIAMRGNSRVLLCAGVCGNASTTRPPG